MNDYLKLLRNLEGQIVKVESSRPFCPQMIVRGKLEREVNGWKVEGNDCSSYFNINHITNIYANTILL